MATRMAMNRRTIATGVLSLLVVGSKSAAAITDFPGFKEGQQVGRGRLSVLLIPVFDLELYAPGGRWAKDRPFGLSVTVLRPLKGQLMAKHATDEIRRNPTVPADRLTQWHAALASILTDLYPGQHAFVLRDDKSATRFFIEGHDLGSIPDPMFTDAFFEICLGPNSTMPALRRDLLNL